MDFITLDFETATGERHSACEIGITVVKDNRICDVISWLIKPPSYPYFDYFNIAIHGIRPKDVENAPTFAELWLELKPLIENQFLIAHNASFDMSVLRGTLDFYNLPYPNLKYSCSYIFSKKIWEGLPSYNLKALCNLNNIQFRHHRAGADSEATAKLVMAAFKKNEINSVSQLSTKLRIEIGEIYERGYKPSRAKKPFKGKQIDGVFGDKLKNDSNHIFYNQIVVISEKMKSVPLNNAYQMIADIGGINAKNVTKSTDFLILTREEIATNDSNLLTTKHKRAINLIKNGSYLEIISEEQFLENMQNRYPIHR